MLDKPLYLCEVVCDVGQPYVVSRFVCTEDYLEEAKKNHRTDSTYLKYEQIPLVSNIYVS